MTVENLTDADVDRLADLLASRNRAPQVVDYYSQLKAMQRRARERDRVRQVISRLRQQFLRDELASARAERQTKYSENAQARAAAAAEIQVLEVDLEAAEQRVADLQTLIAAREAIVREFEETPKWHAEAAAVAAGRAEQRLQQLSTAPMASHLYEDAILDLARSESALPESKLQNTEDVTAFDKALTSVILKHLAREHAEAAS